MGKQDRAFDSRHVSENVKHLGSLRKYHGVKAGVPIKERWAMRLEKGTEAKPQRATARVTSSRDNERLGRPFNHENIMVVSACYKGKFCLHQNTGWALKWDHFGSREDS